MSGLAPNASREEIEEEILFQDVLITSLDEGASDYEQQLAELTATKTALEQRLEAMNTRPASSAYLTGMNMDGANEQQHTSPGRYGQGNGGYIATGAGYGLPNAINGNGGLGPVNGSKRPAPYSALDEQHPSKRQTPEASAVNTPSSSSSSDLMDQPIATSGATAQRARQRQLHAEAALRRRKDELRNDELFARSLSQPGRVSEGPSSQRPGVQTTISHNGSFSRPPPPPPGNDRSVYGSMQQAPKVKPEPGLPVRQLPQSARRPSSVVDLTGSGDDDDDDALEIPPQQFTPSRRTTLAPCYPTLPAQNSPAPPRAQYIPAAMPGAFPASQHVYGAPVQQPPQAPPQYPSSAQQTASAASRLGSMASSFARAGPSDPMDQLRYAALGSRAQPMTFDDSDEEVHFAGTRPLFPELYAGREDLYQNRYDEILSHDPERTKEEINALLENIRPDEDLPDNLLVRTPESMTIRLHKYQELGLTWLKNCEEGTNKGGILADDMGLGKTIQMLSLLVSNKSTDPRCKSTLIIAPVALLRQWEQEIQQKIKPGRHALTVFVHHGQSKKKSFSDLRYYDVVLTTYGTLASEYKKLENFAVRKRGDPQARPLPRERCVIIGDDASWYRVLLDEAQCIKNKNALTTKGANRINATYRFCMTGTPMMNNFEELYSLIHFLKIKPYCDWNSFRAAFISPLKQNEVARERGMKQLQALCRAIMLRRTKKSTFEGRPILVLPERTTNMDSAAFSEDEKNFYQSLQDNMKRKFQKYFNEGTVGQSYTAILVLLLRLRQACCHPHLIKDYSVSAAAGISVETMIDFAKELAPQVVERIRATGGDFECPICLDACTNPAIFIPCGHDCCRDCFVTLADPSNGLREGNEGATKVRCPHCRGDVDPKRITDFDSFKKAHAPELMTEEEKAAMDAEDGDGGESESDSDSDSDDDDFGDPTMGGFIVNDDAEDSETESEDEVKGEDDEKLAGSSKKGKRGKKSKGKRKAKKSGKGKHTDKDKPKLTLAELKRLSQRSASAKKKYLRRLRKSWVSSAKIDRTLELLNGIMDSAEGERVLIFSQWTSLLDLLEVPMEEKGWGYERYDGSMNAKSRADAVDNFKDPRKNQRIMLVSLKAGNAGLNLNCASQVIILDPFWNPYIEEQAIDRAHRIGQTREVKVHRILVEETVEDRIIKIQEDKRALIGEALDESQAKNISRLGVRELAYLFGITNNRNQRIEYQENRRR